MLCAIYKSPAKDETYLYIRKRDDFSPVPQALLESFGQPQFVMLLDLDKRQRLAMADIVKVKAQLEEQGYYLQLPPPRENLLKTFRQQQGITED